MKLIDAIRAMKRVAYVQGAVHLLEDETLHEALIEVQEILMCELKDEPEPEPKPVEQPKPVEDQKPAEEPKPKNQVNTQWLVKDRKECQKCKYRRKDMCDYMNIAGHIRGIPVEECELYKEPQADKTFRHKCVRCGTIFVDNYGRSKLCPECKAGRKKDEPDA